MKQEQLLKKKDSKEKRVEEQQIFTSTAATGVLTNDLLAIMADSEKLVIYSSLKNSINHYKLFVFRE
jgi:hypothetical protein